VNSESSVGNPPGSTRSCKTLISPKAWHTWYVLLSVLDLAPVSSGQTDPVGIALRNSIDLAINLEQLGYHRHWVAEHHGMPGVASSTPAVLLAHLAMATKTIRLGSGGVMLPNHAPLAIAEQFGMLEAIHPGRIDLGLGRAPGTDGLTARALRGTRLHESEDFVTRIEELMGFFYGSFPAEHPYARIQAVPGEGHLPSLWMLGSSDWGAQIAGELSWPYAFAHHFGGGGTEMALQIYRDSFRPSPHLERPYSMIGVQVVCADTTEHARFLAGASALSFLRLRQGRPTQMPTPEQAASADLGASERAFIEDRLNSAVIGDPATVATKLDELQQRLGVDELMITTATYDHADRVRSFSLLAESFDLQQAA
jgi:luciferase family oxidoreductase group 1